MNVNSVVTYGRLVVLSNFVYSPIDDLVLSREQAGCLDAPIKDQGLFMFRQVPISNMRLLYGMDLVTISISKWIDFGSIVS
jgi:hypothetical protein